MAILIGSFSLALMAPELQGMSMFVYLNTKMTDCVVALNSYYQWLRGSSKDLCHYRAGPLH